MRVEKALRTERGVRRVWDDDAGGGERRGEVRRVCCGDGRVDVVC